MLKKSLYILPLLALSLAGCDSDGDGLSDKEEADLGTDPELADSDGDGIDDGEELELGTNPLNSDSDEDGLLDGEEVTAGTNPMSADSDEDGYLDGWEVTEGTDPTNAESLIYNGLWPYNPNKDDAGAPDLESAAIAVGEMIGRFKAYDQFGDEVDMYDFYADGKPVLIDFSTAWCPPCKGLASWLSGQGDTSGFGGVYANIKTLVDNGDIRWITVLAQDASGGVPTTSTVAEWDESYPHHDIPVFASQEVGNKYVQGGWPTVMALDENLTITHMPTAENHWAAMEWANTYTP